MVTYQSYVTKIEQLRLTTPCLNNVATQLITSGLQLNKLVHLTILMGRAHSLHLLMQKCNWSSQRHETNAQEYVIVLTLRVRTDPKETPCKIWFNARNDCSVQEIKKRLFTFFFVCCCQSSSKHQDNGHDRRFFCSDNPMLAGFKI